MAGEQKGKAYEAFTKAALEKLRRKGVFQGDIFWDDKPEGMTIVPDFIIGVTKEAPIFNLLVSHGGSAKESNRKYWRNCGELVECKLYLKTIPKVVSIFFDAVIKADIKKLGAATFDGELFVGDLKYGGQIQEWLESNLERFPKDKNAKTEFLIQEAQSNKELGNLINLFTADLELLLKATAPIQLEQVWAMERRRSPGRAPRARDTFVRRGLSKLLIFEDLDVGLRLYTGKKVKPGEIPDYAFELGLASKAVGRVNPSDDEITNAVNLLGETTVRHLIGKTPFAKIEGWLSTLRNAAHLRFMGEYVASNFNKLKDARTLKGLLKELHGNPSALVHQNLPSGWPPTQVWLLEYLVAMVRESKGGANSYGYAQLGRDVKDAGYTARMGSGNPRIWVGGFILSDWVHRTGEEELDDDDLLGISSVLSAKLKALDLNDVFRIKKTLPAALARNIMEAKLCTYRGFDPLTWLVKGACKTARAVQLRSCFAESAGMTGQVSQTHALVAQNTLINLQSASDAGRDHKKKELCGRAVALRYGWDASRQIFIPRPGIKKLFLVVDGTWRREDLLSLARAGWDEIFYPDEMDKLAAAIV
jgi:hypothetical protein